MKIARLAKSALLAASVSLVARPAPVGAAVINFSRDAGGAVLAPGTTIAEQYAAIGVHFVGSAFDEPANPDDAFAGNTDMRLTTAAGDVPPLAVIPAGAGNFLHAYSGWLAEDGDSNLAIVFDAPVARCSFTIYDDKAGLTQAFAIEGDDIVDATQSAQTSDARPQVLTVSAAGGFTVLGLVLGASTDWVGLDDIAFTPVPEPSVALAGACGLGASLRRRARRL